MNSNTQLSKIPEAQDILATIDNLPDLTSQAKQDLKIQVLSDDIAVRKSAQERFLQSMLAYQDVDKIMSELEVLNKKGMYVEAEQTVETGSGKFKIKAKGGDTKLIIPIAIVVGIVIIALVVAVFA